MRKELIIMSAGTNTGTEKAAIYARLSVEDIEKDSDGSRSIGNQISLLKDYCAEHGYNVYDIYVDDGISGTERNRPDFQRMLKDCEEGKVDIVICKDQSRFSRDDTVIKEYLHEKFFIWHVRFIGVSDNVDSESPDFMDNSSLRGFFNEWYVRDISKKEKAANEILRKQGKYYRCAPYGYIKDPKDKHHLIPDPNTKDIVLRIFESYVGGMSLAKIAEMLNAEGIPSPTAYKKNIYPNYKSVYTDDVWSSDGIRTMLKNEAYIGNTTLGRSYKVSYRSKKKATIPKEQWVRHEGTHEPLVSKELWEMSRPRIECPARASSTTQEIPPLSGKLVCGCCGKYLVHRITGRKRKCDGEYVKYGYYRCPDVMKGKGTCENTRQISYLTLEKAVIEAINNAINAYCDKDKLSIESMQAETMGFITKQHKQLSDKIAKVQHRLDSIYTDKLDGLITADEYVRYREQFNTELAELGTKLSETEEKLTQLEQRRQNAEYCKSLAAKYTNITELTRQLTEDFVDSIVIGIADENGDREVNISLRV